MDLLFVFLQQYLICKKYRQVWCLILKTLLFTYVQYTILELSLVTMEPLMIKKKREMEGHFYILLQRCCVWVWVPLSSHKSIAFLKKFALFRKTFAFSHQTYCVFYCVLSQNYCRFPVKICVHTQNVCILSKNFCVSPRNIAFFHKSIGVSQRKFVF